MRWGVRRRFHAGRGLNSFSSFVVALIAPLRDRLSLARARDTVADPKAREEWTRRQRAEVLRRLLGENEAVPGV